MNPKANEQATDLSVPNITAVSTADLNGDVIPDLVVSSTNGIQVLLNEGGGSLRRSSRRTCHFMLAMSFSPSL